ncbi:MAG: hypothetical protein JNK64_04440 [Myxococcales bacterium]|nr:hypothetical protein [Myxococcales bacterium]
MSARVDLALAGARATLTIDDDPAAARRALVHAAGCAIAHVGALPPGPLAALVLELVRGLAGASPRPSAALAALVVERARVAGADAMVVTAPRLPRWSSRLRTGTPGGAPGAAALWPFDGELAALQLGRRALLKRECFSDAAAAADRAWLAAAGLVVTAVGEVAADGRRVLLAARGAIDPALIAAERAIQRDRDDAAARALGAALGYPACCVDAFVAAAGHDDRALLAALPSPAAAPASALTQWLTQPLALVSHVPCGLGCAATRDLAAAVLAALDAATPGFAARWRDLAARVQVLDHRGRNLALAGAGDLAGGLTITAATAFAVAPDDALGPVAVDAPEAIGRTITAADVLAAADHRGDG